MSTGSKKEGNGGPQALPCLLVTTRLEASGIHTGSLLGKRSKLAKKAECLSLNLKALVDRHGVERIVFVTLTFRENLRSFRKAQRRYDSLNRNVLNKLFVEHVTAVERQQRGAIHYHLIAVVREDVRTGFDFKAWAQLLAHTRLFGRDNAKADALGKLVYRSAPPALSALWKTFREVSPRYGFGRVETYPVRSNADAIGRYVGTYVRTEAENRNWQDKHMRTLRYSLLPGHRVASARFSWLTGPGKAWRDGCRMWSVLTGVDDFEKEWGTRWARCLRFEIGTLGRWADRVGEKFYEQVEQLAECPKAERISETMALIRFLREREEAKAAHV